MSLHSGHGDVKKLACTPLYVRGLNSFESSTSRNRKERGCLGSLMQTSKIKRDLSTSSPWAISAFKMVGGREEEQQVTCLQKSGDGPGDEVGDPWPSMVECFS